MAGLGVGNRLADEFGARPAGFDDGIALHFQPLLEHGGLGGVAAAVRKEPGAREHRGRRLDLGGGLVDRRRRTAAGREADGRTKTDARSRAHTGRNAVCG